MINKQQLLSAGFVVTTYPGQKGVFLTKTMKLEEFGDRLSFLIQDEVDKDNQTVVEVTPCGQVQLFVDLWDFESYFEKPTPIHSENGIALLREAGVTIHPELNAA